jgi:hypothetical protein
MQSAKTGTVLGMFAGAKRGTQESTPVKGAKLLPL